MKLTRNLLRSLIKEELEKSSKQNRQSKQQLPQLQELFGFGKKSKFPAMGGKPLTKNEEILLARKGEAFESWAEAQSWIEKEYSNDAIEKLEADGKTEAAKVARNVKNKVISGEWEVPDLPKDKRDYEGWKRDKPKDSSNYTPKLRGFDPKAPQTTLRVNRPALGDFWVNYLKRGKV